MIFTSSMIAAGSGSIGGTVFSRNRGGQYVRTRAIPVNTNTSQQQAVRSVLSNLAVVWGNTLTQAQRDAWANYAANTPVVNALGQQSFLTAQQWYIKANTARVVNGKTRIDAGPIVMGLAILTPISIVASGTTTLTVSFTNTDPWAIAVNGHLFIYASRPTNPTINNLKGPYRFAGAINGAATPPTSPAVLVSPFVFATAQKQHYRAVVSDQSGRPSPDFRTFDVV